MMEESMEMNEEQSEMNEEQSEILQLNDETKRNIETLQLRQRMLDLETQTTLQADLINKLDPDHNYQYNAQQASFIKTKKEKMNV
jgi:hypothetical protein